MSRKSELKIWAEDHFGRHKYLNTPLCYSALTAPMYCNHFRTCSILNIPSTIVEMYIHDLSHQFNHNHGCKNVRTSKASTTVVSSIPLITLLYITYGLYINLQRGSSLREILQHQGLQKQQDIFLFGTVHNFVSAR